MPQYVYKCEKCNTIIEVEQKITDPKFNFHNEVEQCSVCIGTIHRLIYPSLLQFNGSGFYVNDYKNKSHNNIKT